MRTTGVMAANLFIRSLEFAERSQNALQSRNYRGQVPRYSNASAAQCIVWVRYSAAPLAVVFLAGNYL